MRRKSSVFADTYHAWRGDQDGQKQYEDIPGFCKAATLDDIRPHGYVLTPGRYVGAAVAEDDDEPIAEKMARLTAELKEQTARAASASSRLRIGVAAFGACGVDWQLRIKTPA